jgi:hypothetical protein
MCDPCKPIANQHNNNQKCVDVERMGYDLPRLKCCYYIQFSSQSSNPCKLHLALSHCHIGMKKSTHPGASAGIRAPQICQLMARVHYPVGSTYKLRQLRVQMLSHQRTSGRNLVGSRGHADFDFHVQKPLELCVHFGHQCVFIGGPKRKISESILLLNSQKNGTTADLCGLQMDFTAFHSISQNASLFEANPFGRCIPAATSLPHKRDASSCQEVVQSPRAQDRARNVGKAIINHP